MFFGTGKCFLEPAKYFGQIYALVRPLDIKGASANGLFCRETKDWWRPLEAKSDFGPMFFGTGQVFWLDVCPGQASRGQGCKRRWTFLLRNKRLVEAIRGQIRFWANVFWNRPSIFGQIYALVRPLEVKGASTDGLFC